VVIRSDTWCCQSDKKVARSDACWVDGVSARTPAKVDKLSVSSARVPHPRHGNYWEQKHRQLAVRNVATTRTPGDQKRGYQLSFGCLSSTIEV
jgi:hypothetical protein